MLARSDSGTEIVPAGQNGVTGLGAWAGQIAQQANLAFLMLVKALLCLLFGQVPLGDTHTEKGHLAAVTLSWSAPGPGPWTVDRSCPGRSPVDPKLSVGHVAASALPPCSAGVHGLMHFLSLQCGQH